MDYSLTERCYRNRTIKKRHSIYDCTDAEYIELSVRFEHYWKDYQAQQMAFYHAYIHKNDLGMRGGAGKELTLEERERMVKLAAGIKSTSPLKRIG